MKIKMIMLACGLCATGAVAADRYPERPVRLVVASAPGGGTDFVARAMNDKFSEFLGNQVVVDNRGGAGGRVGTQIVHEAPGDGYTILQIFTNFAILPSLHKNLPFSVTKDFAPVINLVSSPLILVVNPSLPAKSVQELISLAKAKKGELNFAAPGIGSLGHLSGEFFKLTANVDMQHVAYKGGGPSITALVGNQVQMYFSTLPAAIVQVKAGRLRPLGVTSLKRTAVAPDVPTIAEQGLKDFEVVGWFGIFTSSKAPANAIKSLNAAANKALQVKAVSDRLVASGVAIEGGTPEVFRQKVVADVAKWGRVAERAGLKK